MNQPPNAYAVIGAMLDIDPAILRALSEPWLQDPTTPPINMLDFATRVADAKMIAAQLNNTNLTELAIREAYDPKDIPPTLPTAGVPRLIKDDDE